MNPEHVTLIYFSPTATTRIVLEGVAQGMGLEIRDSIDITRPEIREDQAPHFSDQLVIIGAPVYGGRLPKDAADYYSRMTASGTPAVLVVLYGNREFEDALLELKDISADQGFVPIAGAAFIGEHSFCSDEFQIARSRPDEKDMNAAREFGQQVIQWLRDRDLKKRPDLSVPGNFPYKEVASRGVIPFLDVTEDCVECGVCAAACPKSCIDETDHFATIDELCIHCCACVKVCPEQARVLKDGPIKDIARWLSEHFETRKEPQTFMAE